MSAIEERNSSDIRDNACVSGEASCCSSTSQRQFTTHIKLYALVNSTRDLIFMIPLIKRSTTCFSPTVQLIRNSSPIKGVLDRGDTIADGALNKLDNFAPNLKKYTYSDLHLPISRPANGAWQSSHRILANTNDSIKTAIIEPSARTVHDLRDRFHYVVYDNDGKGIISSSVDPLVAPLNELLEGFVVKRFPECKTSSTTHSSELSRTIRIIANVIMKSSGSSSELEEEIGEAHLFSQQSEVRDEQNNTEIKLDEAL